VLIEVAYEVSLYSTTESSSSVDQWICRSVADQPVAAATRHSSLAGCCAHTERKNINQRDRNLSDSVSVTREAFNCTRLCRLHLTTDLIHNNTQREHTAPTLVCRAHDLQGSVCLSVLFTHSPALPEIIKLEHNLQFMTEGSAAIHLYTV
jgi:hypothetical protein